MFLLGTFVVQHTVDSSTPTRKYIGLAVVTARIRFMWQPVELRYRLSPFAARARYVKMSLECRCKAVADLYLPPKVWTRATSILLRQANGLPESPHPPFGHSGRRGRASRLSRRMRVVCLTTEVVAEAAINCYRKLAPQPSPPPTPAAPAPSVPQTLRPWPADLNAINASTPGPARSGLTWARPRHFVPTTAPGSARPRPARRPPPLRVCRGSPSSRPPPRCARCWSRAFGCPRPRRRRSARSTR